MGNVDCLKKVGPDLVNQHLLCQGGHFEKLKLEEENRVNRDFSKIYPDFSPLHVSPKLTHFNPEDPMQFMQFHI